MRIRELRDGEAGFLREVLVVALAWRPDVELPPVEFVHAHPQVVVFHRDWCRAGDSALVADDEGALIGAAWFRYFTEEEHGEGFMDNETPELAIAVVEGFRGQGIGRGLLEALHERALGDGVARISLSVDAENPAKKLYKRLGYVDYEPDDGLGRMILELDP